MIHTNNHTNIIIPKITISYLYFMQGIFLSLLSNVPYFYPTFPSATNLSYFSLAVLPFSIKYITGIYLTIQP